MQAPWGSPALDAATVARLLQSYLIELKRAAKRYPYLDRHELRAVWEDAVCEAYLSHDAAKSAEATWVNRVFHSRLTSLVRASSPKAAFTLGTDPPILNGVNPEQAFWEASAMARALQLPPRQQTILIACLNGSTYAEAGAEVGISKQVAHREYSRALKTLRERVGLGKDLGDGDDERS